MMVDVTKRYRAPVAAALALMLGLAACGSGGSESRAGGSAGPVTLKLVSPDAQGRPGAEQAEAFGRRVNELSGGEITIEYDWGEPGTGVDDWDQVAARKVIDGSAQLGMVPARAWDVLGPLTLRPLNAPFLLTSEDAVNTVLTSDLVPALMAGLDQVGVTGLGLYPEGMRRLFLVGEEPVALSEIGGHFVRSPTSDTGYAFFEALGAIPDDFGDVSDREEAAMADGTLVAWESSLLLAGTSGLPMSAVGDVALYPKVNSLVVNSSAFDELSDEHRQILREAAAATLPWAIDQIPSDADSATQFCADGGRVIFDSSAQGLMDDAAASVLDQLDDDPATATLIGRIRAVQAEAAPAPALTACDGTGTAAVGTVTSEGPFPEGVYRGHLEYEMLVDRGVGTSDARNHAGVWTLTFSDGQVTIKDVNDATGLETEGTSAYCVENGRVSLGFGDVCGDFWNAAWEAGDDQIRFVDVVSDHGSQELIAALFGGVPFTKIG